MRPGKLPEPSLRRAVLGQLKTGTSYREKNIGVGSDAGFCMCEGTGILTSDAVITADSPAGLYFGFQRGANRLLAAGGIPKWTTETLLLPETIQEPEIRRLMAELDALCGGRKIEIIGGKTWTLPGLREAVINLHFMGTRHCGDFPLQTEPGKVHAGDAIVMSGFPAADLAGTWLEEEREALGARFCPEFLRQARERIFGPDGIRFLNRFSQRQEMPQGMMAGSIAKSDREEFSYSEMDHTMSVEKTAVIAMDLGVKAMHDIGEGGVFGALRELGERESCGLEVDLRKIPVLQEVIELCEFFDRNPYQTKSCGALLMVSSAPEELLRALAEAGIRAEVIGQITEGKKRILYRGEEIRYIDHAQEDECWKEGS